MTYFIFNGKICKAPLSVVGADNRGLRYGDGLFETMKLKNGRLLFEDEHFARLWNGMKVLQFEIPKHFTADSLLQEITQLAKKNGHENIVRVRLNVFRGDGGLYDATNHSPNYIIQTWALPETNGEWNSNGLVLGIYREVKKSCDILCNLKHNNYLPYILAALNAKKEKWNDAIILNTNERICDTTIANIFVIKNEMISTPALSEGCVAGVLRKYLVKELESKQFQVKQSQIDIEELLSADEIFLTNSIYNIRWVKQIGDREFTNILTKKAYASVISNT